MSRCLGNLPHLKTQESYEGIAEELICALFEYDLPSGREIIQKAIRFSEKVFLKFLVSCDSMHGGKSDVSR